MAACAGGRESKTGDHHHGDGDGDGDGDDHHARTH